ncbi:MAG: M23 family metallopeptidase [Salibacteraceae bacterium]
MPIHLLYRTLFVAFLFLFNGYNRTSAQEFKAINPLNIQASLSGNFGELRPNHFHAGIDLKTAGREGLEVKSVADGFVSRVKVSPFGYGNVVYIDHPSGYTTVYAHLKSFEPAIEAFVKKQQYTLKTNEVDVYPGKNELIVKQGDIIALSGNSGGSGGPHLHFEVRETATEVPRNPLLFNFPVDDHKAPVIEAIAIVPLSSQSAVAGKNQSFRSRVSSNRIMAQQPVQISGSFGLQLRGYDSQDGSYNHNGIYEIEVFVNDQRLSRFVADSIPFDVSRHLNALIDYDYYYYNKSRFVCLYRLPGNLLPNIQYKNDGKINLPDGKHNITLITRDFHGNESTVSFEVEVKQPSKKDEVLKSDSLRWNVPYLYESGRFEVYFPANCVYENQVLSIEERMVNDVEIISLFKVQTPVQEAFVIETPLPENELSKGWLIAQCTESGSPIRALSTNYSNGFLKAESRSFGHFRTYQDLIPPKIQSYNFSNGKNWSNGLMKFKITDNFSDIYRINCFVNEEWIVSSYEPKQDLLTIDVDELIISENEQHLMIEISDLAGNVATFDGNFYRR